MLKEGQSLANTSPGTCLRASFYARAPLAAPFTPYSIRSLTIVLSFRVVVAIAVNVVCNIIYNKVTFERIRTLFIVLIFFLANVLYV